MDSIVRTDFDFKDLTGKYTGKVRDVYFIKDKYMVMVATDRMCATTTRLSKNASRFGGARRTAATSGTTRIRANSSPGFRRRHGISSISSK